MSDDLNLFTKQPCDECNGEGRVTYTRTVTFPTEGLSGTTYVDDSVSFPETRTCPSCNGAGERWDPFLIDVVTAAWGRFDPNPVEVLDAIRAYMVEAKGPDDDAWRREGRTDGDWPDSGKGIPNG